MKPFLLQYLICPTDKQPLDLKVFNQKELSVSDETKAQAVAKGISLKEIETELIDGLLLNKRLLIFYPLFRGVPRLLLFQHPLIDEFKRSFEQELKEFYAQGFKFPNDDSIPGEKNVLASFSNEWTDYDYNEEAYWGQTSEVYNNSRNRQAFNYLWEWFDQAGMVVATPMTTGTTREIEGKDSIHITATAPNPRARDFKLRLIEAR